VTWSTPTPRSASSSSRSRYDNPNRRYHRTASTITAGGNRTRKRRCFGLDRHTGPATLHPDTIAARHVISQCNSAIEAARRVSAGGTALDPEVVRALLARPSMDDGLLRLTERERIVLTLLAEGRSNQAIADELHLAVRSVEKHIAAVFLKLDLPADTTDHRRMVAVLRFMGLSDGVCIRA
jgi:DNA-binding CsgD family transcriptional regulator